MEQAIVDKRAATPRVQALRDRQKGDAGLEEQEK